MDHKIRNILDTKAIIGLCIIAAGILILLENLGVYLGFYVWDWWPMILILIGLGQIVQPKETRQFYGGLIIIIIGFLFLINNLDIYYFHWRNVWPIILILIGINILRHHVWVTKEDASDINFINLFFFLGGGDNKFTSNKLKGGRITAIMGGGTIDLRDTSFEDDVIIIEAFAFWGGIDIRVPQEWQVNMQGTPILAGMENKTTVTYVDKDKPAPWQSGKRLIIKGTAIMAGIEVKN